MNIIKTDTKKLMMTIVNAIDEWAEDEQLSEYHYNHTLKTLVDKIQLHINNLLNE